MQQHSSAAYRLIDGRIPTLAHQSAHQPESIPRPPDFKAEPRGEHATVLAKELLALQPAIDPTPLVLAPQTRSPSPRTWAVNRFRPTLSGRGNARVSIHSRSGRACTSLSNSYSPFFHLRSTSQPSRVKNLDLRSNSPQPYSPRQRPLPLSSFPGSAEASPAASIIAAAHSAVHKDIFIRTSLFVSPTAKQRLRCAAVPRYAQTGAPWRWLGQGRPAAELAVYAFLFSALG